MTSGIEQDAQAQEAANRDPYANAVVDALAGDFPGLRDPVTAGIVRKHVYLNAQGGGILGEIIVDNPTSANWRLVRDPRRPGRVKLRCWRPSLTVRDHEVLERLNTALRQLGATIKGDTPATG